MIGSIPLNLLRSKTVRNGARESSAARRTPRSSLLGLALNGHRLEAILVRRSNDSVRVQATTAASLQLNLLTDDAELVGREIRNHLDRAGIRERQCSVCIPLEWALTAHVRLPELPAEDVASFLELEAERGFPFPPESLLIASSRCKAANGAEFVTLIGVPRDHLATLQRVLKAAQLKPVSFSLGMTALQPPSASNKEGIAALGIGESSVELQVTCGGGITALRTVQGALEQDGVHKKPYVDVIARDLRITLGQLPPELLETLRRLRVFAHEEDTDRFLEELGARTKAMGLVLEHVKRYAPAELGLDAPADLTLSPACSLAVRLLSGEPAPLEFLPPKVSAWKQLTQRYSSAKLVWTGAAAGAILLLVAAGFMFQQWQLGRWRTKWNGMKTRVTQLQDMQQQIRRFRPWFDDSLRSLTILQRITEAFPEDGAVSAKTVEIRDPGSVTCSGTARDQQALLKVVDQLRAVKEFSSVQVDVIRGKQFTINIHWGEGSSQ